MKSKKFTVIDPHGINSRTYAKIVGAANKFKSHLVLKFHREEADLKSIMNVMALIIKNNDRFEISAEGADENEALTHLENLLKEINIIE